MDVWFWLLFRLILFRCLRLWNRNAEFLASFIPNEVVLLFVRGSLEQAGPACPSSSKAYSEAGRVFRFEAGQGDGAATGRVEDHVVGSSGQAGWSAGRCFRRLSPDSSIR